jgi:hypothetical protein
MAVKRRVGRGTKPAPFYNMEWRVAARANTHPTLYTLYSKSLLSFRLGAFFSLGDGCSEALPILRSLFYLYK